MLIDIEKNDTFVATVAVKLFALMRQSGIKCIFHKESGALFSYVFEIKDLTEDGTPFGLAFKIDQSIISEVENTPESIERFCFNMALNMGTRMLQEKISRLLQHAEKSTIVLPG